MQRGRKRDYRKLLWLLKFTRLSKTFFWSKKNSSKTPSNTTADRPLICATIGWNQVTKRPIKITWRGKGPLKESSNENTNLVMISIPTCACYIDLHLPYYTQAIDSRKYVWASIVWLSCLSKGTHFISVAMPIIFLPYFFLSWNNWCLTLGKRSLHPQKCVWKDLLSN